MMERNEIPAIVREDPDGRTASIARKDDGVPIGAALFFTPEELIDVGVDPMKADAIELHIMNGEIQLVPIATVQSEE